MATHLEKKKFCRSKPTVVRDLEVNVHIGVFAIKSSDL